MRFSNLHLTAHISLFSFPLVKTRTKRKGGNVYNPAMFEVLYDSRALSSVSLLLLVKPLTLTLRRATSETSMVGIGGNMPPPLKNHRWTGGLMMKLG